MRLIEQKKWRNSGSQPRWVNQARLTFFFSDHLNIDMPKTESSPYGNSANDWVREARSHEVKYFITSCQWGQNRLDMLPSGYECWSDLKKAEGSKISLCIFNDDFMFLCSFSHLHGRWRHYGRGALVSHRGRRQGTLRSRQGRWSRRWGKTRHAGDMTGLSICMNDDGGTKGLVKVDEI